ncbi:MAG TPA: alpha/beta hydrolase [Saprospiraceae bacterium]|nr:alpha/beta hydrolase [Saprospiraceae bacterium]
MKMRKSDSEIMSFLEKQKVHGVIDTLTLRNRQIVYLKTSNDQKHKDAVIFVHGSPGSIDAFLEYMADTALLSRADLVTYDRPGFGHSGFGFPETTLSGQANILTDMMKVLGYQHYWLVGHSYGGPIIVQSAIRHPKNISGMAMIAGSVSPELEPKAKWRKWIDLPLLKELFPVSLTVSNEELLPLKHDLIMIEDDWDRIRVPVSLIQGTKDVLVPFQNLEYAKEKLTNADTVRTLIFEDENHFIPWSKKDEIVRELVELMKL